jgi:D-3-phosphoglycerate dehydrogenase
MKDILKLNPISGKVNDILGDNYSITDSATKPEGILVRSFDMHDYEMPSSVLCVARAGAGVNNSPCEEYAE